MLSNFEKIVYNISHLAQGRAVTLCAVGKTQSAEAVQEALNLGITDIGENRVQEAEAKFPLLGGGRRHLIGPLQSNKEAKALRLFDVIQTLESLDQCRRLGEAVQRLGFQKSFYIQVNTSGEAQKHGVSGYDEAAALAEEILRWQGCALEGLMTLGPMPRALESNPAALRVSAPRPCFAALREVGERLQNTLGIPLGLSMGMSGDYEIAIEEGSTLVRLGTLLFGQRNIL